MTTLTMYSCDQCGKLFSTQREAMMCERSHIVNEQPFDKLVSQKDFCDAVGITPVECKQIRELGYIPYYGDGRCKIPLRIGAEGVMAYVVDMCANHLGKNAKYKFA